MVHHYIQRTMEWCTIIYSAPLNGTPSYCVYSAPLNRAPLYTCAGRAAAARGQGLAGPEQVRCRALPCSRGAPERIKLPEARAFGRAALCKDLDARAGRRAFHSTTVNGVPSYLVHSAPLNGAPLHIQRTIKCCTIIPYMRAKKCLL